VDKFNEFAAVAVPHAPADGEVEGQRAAREPVDIFGKRSLLADGGHGKVDHVVGVHRK
jgi:hypothetical protein